MSDPAAELEAALARSREARADLVEARQQLETDLEAIREWKGLVDALVEIGKDGLEKALPILVRVVASGAAGGFLEDLAKKVD